MGWEEEEREESTVHGLSLSSNGREGSSGIITWIVGICTFLGGFLLI